jgi:hypothetical protein
VVLVQLPLRDESQVGKAVVQMQVHQHGESHVGYCQLVVVWALFHVSVLVG